MIVPHDRAAIQDSIRRQCEHGHYPVQHIYGSGDSRTRIAELLLPANQKAQK